MATAVTRWPTAKGCGPAGDDAAGANVAGFVKTAHAMLDQGTI
jgi:hypothetical protein